MRLNSAFARFLLCLAACIVLPSTAAFADVTGAVLDPHGQPVPGARVQLLGGIGLETRADAGGRFRLRSLPDGPYRLLISAPGLSLPPQVLEVRNGAAAVEVRLRMAAQSDIVVVTTERAEMPANSVASSTTVVTRDELERMHVENVGDALRHVPGMSVAQSGRRGGVSAVFARGGNANFNLVMVDGVPVNDFGGYFNFANVPVDTVDRIEVVRGPQSALYGLNAIGSVINIITRRPAGPLETHALAEGGSFGTERTAMGASGRAGRAGWNVDLVRETSDGPVANDRYRNEAASLNLSVETSRSSRLRYTLLADANAVGAPGPYDFAPVDLETRGKENSYVNGLSWEWQHGRLRHKITASFYNDHVGYVSAYGPYDTWQSRAGVSGETSFQMAEGDELAVGLDYQRERFRNTFVTDSTFKDFPLRRGDLGWYAENRWERGGRLFLNTGIRLQRIHTGAMPGDGYARPDFSANNVMAVSPKVSVAGLPYAGGSLKLHASAGTGLRAPDGFELAFTNNGSLRPERTLSFDAGVEKQLWNRRATFDATFFRNRYHDLIVTLGGSISILSRFQSDNLANSLARGVEFSANLRPVETLAIDAHYTWLKSALLSLDHAPGAVPDPFRVGDPLLRRPAHSGAFLVSYQMRRRVTWTVGAVARSHVLDVHPVFGAGGGLLWASGYVKPDAGVEVMLTREVSAYGRLYNFTDERYEDVLGYPALRRNFVAGLKFHWH